MRNHRDRQRQLSLQETSMRSRITKTRDPRSRGTPRSPLSSLPMRADFKRPGASAANAADRASSIHQMKSDAGEPSNNRPTLIKVGRRKVVHIARRLTVRQDPWSLMPRLQDEINRLFGNVQQTDSS